MATPRIQLVALVPLRHDDARVEKGSKFTAPERRAEQLVADGAAEYVDPARRAAFEKTPAAAELKRKSAERAEAEAARVREQAAAVVEPAAGDEIGSDAAQS